MITRIRVNFEGNMEIPNEPKMVILHKFILEREYSDVEESGELRFTELLLRGIQTNSWAHFI